MSGSEHPTEKFTRLGEECEEGKPDNVWQCRIEEFMKPIVPNDYFLTSGEAVAKTERLISDIRVAMADAINFLRLLQEVKGKNKYLETEVVDGHVIFRSKNPRKKNKNAKNNKQRK